MARSMDTLAPASEKPALLSPDSFRSGLPSLGTIQPIMSAFLRCPMPPLGNVSPDNLRQFYYGGAIPQYRVNPPNLLS